MKKKLLLASVAFLTLHSISAQNGVGIGKTILPDATTVLDVGSDDKGILIPRVTLASENDTTTIKGGTYPESLLVYHKKQGTSILDSGYYFWLDGKWNALVSKTTTTTSEVLTTLAISDDKQKVVLTYTGENKVPVTLAVSDRLQSDPTFKLYIQGLVTSTAAGVDIKAGTGVEVTSIPPKEGETLTTFTISAKPEEITLGGDVSGKANNITVDKIKNIPVVVPTVVNNGQALIYDDTTKSWKTGKPIVDIDNITAKAALTTDGSIVIGAATSTETTLSDAVLKATTLSIKDAGISTAKLADNAVTEEKIKAEAVSIGKIKGSGNNMVLSTDGSGKAVWTPKTDIATKAALTTDGSIVIGAATSTETTLTDVVLKATTLSIKDAGISTTKLADNAVTEEKIKAEAVSIGKIKGSGNNMVLSTDNTGKAVWTPKTDIATKAAIESDGIIDITGATNNKLADAVLVNTKLSIKDASITGTKIKDASVEGGKLIDSTVDIKKLIKGNNSTVLITDATGNLKWEKKDEIATKATLTTDGSIVIGAATSTETTLADAVLKATTLSIKDGGITTAQLANNSVTNTKIKDSEITISKLATDVANKNKHLTTDASGKPQWENKLTFIKTTPVATTDVVDGKRVYTLRVINGTVEEPNTASPLGYNTIIKAIPVANLEYLLTAQIYDKTNKFVTNVITDVINSKGVSVQFRFGTNNMYSTLPVGTDYIVVLRYVSNETVTE